MKRSNYFHGKYYKFISLNGYAFAFIDVHSSEGHYLQIITPKKSFYDIDPQVVTIDGHNFKFDVKIKGLTIKGVISIDKFRPLKRKVMGPFTYIPGMECKHDIFSMHHYLTGTLMINGKRVNFDHGYGYIEGDKGRNFPKEYIWFNSVTSDASVTVAIASIPFGLFTFTGLLGFVKIGDKEYYLSTYNFAKILKKENKEIIIQKGQYRLQIKVATTTGYKLKSPVQGKMVRLIKENISVPSKVLFTYRDQKLLEIEDKNSSVEWMF